jgi:hypothetical protein
MSCCFSIFEVFPETGVLFSKNSVPITIEFSFERLSKDPINIPADRLRKLFRFSSSLNENLDFSVTYKLLKT